MLSTNPMQTHSRRQSYSPVAFPLWLCNRLTYSANYELMLPLARSGYRNLRIVTVRLATDRS